MSEPRITRQSDLAPSPAEPVVPAGRRAASPAVSDDTRLAVEIRGLVEHGNMDEARERYSGLVAVHQRRASRIAYQYLRDTAEADEAVQDAFVKAFSHLTSYREAWPFEVWLTRILINGCLDRRKARARRDRWFAPADAATGLAESTPAFGGAGDLDPEARLLARERRARLAAAIDRLDGRQRSVFMLCHFGDCTPREVSAMTGLNESTVRVHLFRAARKLRGFLGGKP
ncbi:MAG: sigma-70 family RNA polymerase sigma factor [Luteitalea sp.]|nr:sigma-70 family RNA polymerase sigma factor [Luteitalea sp.]